MDSIIHNIIFLDIGDYIISINNIGIIILNYNLETIFKKNINNIYRFKYKRNKYISYISKYDNNILHIYYNETLTSTNETVPTNDETLTSTDETVNVDNNLYCLYKQIYLAQKICKFFIFNNIVFISDINKIYFYKDSEIYDTVSIFINSSFEVLKFKNLYKIIYQSDKVNLVICEMKFDKNTKNIKNIIPHKSSISKFKLSNCGNYCLTTSIKGTILRIFKLINYDLVKEFRISYYNIEINLIKISHNNKWIIILYNNYYIKIFKFNLNQLFFLENYYSYFYIQDMNFKITFNKSNEDYFYIATETGKLILLEIKENEPKILNITRFMDNNFNEMIRMNLSFN